MAYLIPVREFLQMTSHNSHRHERRRLILPTKEMGFTSVNLIICGDVLLYYVLDHLRYTSADDRTGRRVAGMSCPHRGGMCAVEHLTTTDEFVCPWTVIQGPFCFFAPSEWSGGILRCRWTCHPKNKCGTDSSPKARRRRIRIRFDTGRIGLDTLSLPTSKGRLFRRTLPQYLTWTGFMRLV